MSWTKVVLFIIFQILLVPRVTRTGSCQACHKGWNKGYAYRKYKHAPCFVYVEALSQAHQSFQCMQEKIEEPRDEGYWIYTYIIFSHYILPLDESCQRNTSVAENSALASHTLWSIILSNSCGSVEWIAAVMLFSIVDTSVVVEDISGLQQLKIYYMLLLYTKNKLSLMPWFSTPGSLYCSASLVSPSGSSWRRDHCPQLKVSCTLYGMHSTSCKSSYSNCSRYERVTSVDSENDLTWICGIIRAHGAT